MNISGFLIGLWLLLTIAGLILLLIIAGLIIVCSRANEIEDENEHGV